MKPKKKQNDFLVNIPEMLRMLDGYKPCTSCHCNDVVFCHDAKNHLAFIPLHYPSCKWMAKIKKDGRPWTPLSKVEKDIRGKP